MEDRLLPPSREAVVASCSQLAIPTYRSVVPFYSHEADRQADKQKDLKQTVAGELPTFPGARHSLEQIQEAALAQTYGAVVPRLSSSLAPDSQADPRRRVLLQTVRRPPSRAQIDDWFRMRTAMTVHERNTADAISVEGGVAVVSSCHDESAMDFSQDELRSDAASLSGKRKKVYVVKHDEDSDGSEMSCSSLSSSEECPPQLSSAARTRPIEHDDCSPILTKVASQKKLPRRSIMKRRGSSRREGCIDASSPSPILSQASRLKSRDPVLHVRPLAALVESRDGESGGLPARLKRRRISWHLPGESGGSAADVGSKFSSQQEEKKFELEDEGSEVLERSSSGSRDDQLSESLLCRVKVRRGEISLLLKILGGVIKLVFSCFSCG
jgi:hypothetical protein